MVGVLLVAHAPLASALKAVAEHTFPECGARLVTLDVLSETAPEDTLAQARALVRGLQAQGQADVLVLTDVLGATPYNVVRQLVDGEHVQAVTGVNVPMLWRTLCYGQALLPELVERARGGGVQGVASVDSPAVS